MAAGTVYAKRYVGGFVDGSAGNTPEDSQFLNAVEAALLQLLGAAPTADGQVAQWDNVNTRYGPALLLNKNIDPAAAISSTKIDFTGGNGIVNANVASAAAILLSKLDTSGTKGQTVVSTGGAQGWAALAGAPATTLPASPGNGQFAILTDSVTVPTYNWLFMWSTAPTTPSWIFCGGPPAYVAVETQESQTSSTYADLATVGPTFTLPRAGGYVFDWGVAEIDGTNGALCKVALKFAAATTVDADAVINQYTIGVNGQPFGLTRSKEYTGLASGAAVKVQYASNTAGTTRFAKRWLKVTPTVVT